MEFVHHGNLTMLSSNDLLHRDPIPSCGMIKLMHTDDLVSIYQLLVSSQAPTTPTPLILASVQGLLD